MDKLEAIKSKLSEMIEQCESNYRCNECSYKDKCYERLAFHTPEFCLKIIENCEELLID